MTWDEFSAYVRLLVLHGREEPMRMYRAPGTLQGPLNRGRLVANRPENLLQPRLKGRKFVWIYGVGVVIQDGTQPVTHEELAGTREMHCAGILMGDYILFDTRDTLVQRRHVLHFFADMVRQNTIGLMGPRRDAVVDRIASIRIATSVPTGETLFHHFSTFEREIEGNGELLRAYGHLFHAYASEREPLLLRPTGQPARPLTALGLEGRSSTARLIAGSPIDHGRARLVPEGDVIRCQSCGVTFGVHIPKRHCAQCGNVFCAQCLGHLKPVPYPAGEKNEIPSHEFVQVCKACFARRDPTG